MKKILFALTASAALLAGCTSMEGDGMASTAGGPADMTPEDRTNYVMMAGASDLYEIQSSQLATQRAQSADIRQFAQMLIADHTNSTQQLMAAARAAGMNPPPPTLLPMQREMIQELQGASGDAFDRLYARQQVMAHQMALNLHQNYARSGDTPALRTVAGAVVPVITGHLERARQLD